MHPSTVLINKRAYRFGYLPWFAFSILLDVMVVMDTTPSTNTKLPEPQLPPSLLPKLEENILHKRLHKVPTRNTMNMEAEIDDVQGEEEKEMQEFEEDDDEEEMQEEEDDDDDDDDDDACTDMYESCSTWAERGECTENPTYMCDYCCESCTECHSKEDSKNVLPPHTLDGSLCVDKHRKCTRWASQGECQDNPEYMLSHCPNACQTCFAEETNKRQMTNNDPTVDRDQQDSACQDHNKRCPLWAELGECIANPKFMSEKCPKSCRKCKGNHGHTSKGPTVQPVSIRLQQQQQRQQGVVSNQQQFEAMDSFYEPMVHSSYHENEPITNFVCEDSHERCPIWAEDRKCIDNYDYMKRNCQRSCEFCTA